MRRFSALVTICLFIFFFLFILFYIDPPVIYSNNGFDLYNWVHVVHIQGWHPGNADYLETGFDAGFHPIYNLELTRSFFSGAFSRPGGFIFLAVCLMIAACHIPLLGAVVILLAALLIFWAFRVYIKNSRGPDLLITGWIPCILVFLSCCLYDLYLFGFFIAITGVLMLAILYQRISGKGFAVLAGFFALFWLSYYLFQWAALLFLALVVIHEAFNRPRRMLPLGVVVAVSLAVLYFLESRFLPLESTIQWKEFITPPLPPAAIICYFPLVALGVRLRFSPQIRRRIGNPPIRAALVVLIAAAAVFYSISNPVMRDTRTIGRTMHHMLNGQWDAILKEDASSIFRNESAVLLQVLMVNVVDRALYKLHLLGDEMFAHPQSHNYAESLLLLDKTVTTGYVNWAAGLDLYMDLGAANTAEKVAGEMMGKMGPFPFLLERRALIQCAKGNYEAATVYCSRLRGMPFYRRKAEGLLAKIENRTIAQDSGVSHLAGCMDTSDYLLYSSPDDSVLNNLLKRNPCNRMAWEYLIAYYLQTQPSKILGIIDGFRDFGYTHLPVNWDQALCIVRREAYDQNAARVPMQPRRETEEYYERFLRAYSSCRERNIPPGAAVKELEPSFGPTYFFYYIFGFTRGIMR